MTFRSKVLLAAAIAMVLMGGGYVLLRQNEFASGAGSDRRGLAQIGGASPSAVSLVVTEVTGHPGALPPTNKEAAYAQLIGKAEAADYAALLEVQTIRAECLEFSPPISLLPLEKRVLAGSVTNEIRQTAAWKRAYADQQEWCGSRTDLDDRVEALVGNKAARLRTYAERGDKFAVLYERAGTEGKLSESTSNIAIDLLKGGAQGGSAARLVHLLLDSKNPTVAELDRVHFGGAFEDAYRRQIKHAVMMIYSCGNGLPCGSNASYQRGLCIMRGWCDVALSVPAYMARYELSPEQMRVAQSYARQLRQLVAP